MERLYEHLSYGDLAKIQPEKAFYSNELSWVIVSGITSLANPVIKQDIPDVPDKEALTYQLQRIKDILAPNMIWVHLYDELEKVSKDEKLVVQARAKALLSLGLPEELITGFTYSK